MKKRLIKSSLWQSSLSLVALSVFILMAIGSIPTIYFLSPKTIFIGEKHYEKTYDTGSGTKFYSGKRDWIGRWQGDIRIIYKNKENEMTGYEDVNMKNGLRDGESVFTRSDGTIERVQYKMGQKVNAKKAASISTADITGFQVLGNKYPWFLYSLNSLGYEDIYVEVYMDTLEKLLYTYEFNELDFNDNYLDVIDSLEVTPYDSIITLNSTLSAYQGLDELLNDELRLAVIDRYDSDGNTTYNMVETTYPGYLLTFNDAGVTDQDFEGFCHVLDSLMNSYGSLDLEDPFFSDSVDVRMYRALVYIYENGGSELKAMRPMKSIAQFYDQKDLRSRFNKVHQMLHHLFMKSDHSDVVEVVLFLMLQRFDQGDILKRSVREAYLTNNGVILIPTLATEYSGSPSSTSVTLQGYVIADGGGTVTSRGIAWADFYNPTTSDFSETSGTGMGNFSVTISNLIEGNTYYARTYATNSAGTAYGNCVTFTAGEAVGIMEEKFTIQEFHVYPNPAATLTTFRFKVESSENMELRIINLKGQAVYHRSLGSLPQGENQVQLDLSSLQNGIYSCQLTTNGTIKGRCKLVISR